MTFKPRKGNEWTNWEKIRPSNKTEFITLYRRTMVLLRQVERKLEQMASRYKELEKETPGNAPRERE